MPASGRQRSLKYAGARGSKIYYGGSKTGSCLHNLHNNVYNVFRAVADNAEQQQTNFNMAIKPEIVESFRFSCTETYVVANNTTVLSTLDAVGDDAIGIFQIRAV